MRARFLVPALYIIFLLLPIYWLLNMSFKTTNEILGGFTLGRTTSRSTTTGRSSPIRPGTMAMSTRSPMW